MSLSTPNTATSTTTTSGATTTTHGSNVSKPVKAAANLSQPPRFCIICCEETEVTQAISKEIAQWNLPGVRSLLLSTDAAQSPINAYRHNIPSFHADAVARSEYAIFITPSEQPCSQIKVNPLNKVCDQRRSSKQAPAQNHPSMLLTALHNCHGHSPQAWWLQLPTTEIRAKCTQPISCQKAVAQALNKIGIFMRNYQITMATKAANTEAANNREKPAAIREMAADKVALHY
ncbi:MAG: hypothetical protein AB8B99_07870 [Phormidesmis sp.]